MQFIEIEEHKVHDSHIEALSNYMIRPSARLSLAADLHSQFLLIPSRLHTMNHVNRSSSPACNGDVHTACHWKCEVDSNLPLAVVARQRAS
jgi:hypothetical protein